MFGFVLGIFALGVSAFLAIYGQTAVASIIGGSTVLGLVYGFVKPEKKTKV